MLSPLSIAMNLESRGSSMISESDILTIRFTEMESSIIILSEMFFTRRAESVSSIIMLLPLRILIALAISGDFVVRVSNRP